MFGCRASECPASLRLFLAVCGLTAEAACHSTDAATPTSAAKTIVFLTGPPTGAYNPLGTALADVYARTIPGVHFTAVAADGPTGAASNAAWLELGKADLAFSRSDIAYLAFRNGAPEDARPYGHLRSMAVLYANVVHIMARRDSGIRRAEDIRGHRVQMPEDQTASRLTLLVLEALGLTLQDVQVRPLLPGAGGSMALRDAEVRIFAAAYPLASIEASGPPGKARGARVPGVCQRRATQPGGMHRRPQWQSHSRQGPTPAAAQPLGNSTVRIGANPTRSAGCRNNLKQFATPARDYSWPPTRPVDRSGSHLRRTLLDVTARTRSVERGNVVANWAVWWPGGGPPGRVGGGI